MAEWKSVSSPPTKDGWYLACGGKGIVAQVYWFKDKQQFWFYNMAPPSPDTTPSGWMKVTATHWMMLPVLPTQEQ